MQTLLISELSQNSAAFLRAIRDQDASCVIARLGQLTVVNIAGASVGSIPFKIIASQKIVQVLGKRTLSTTTTDAEH